MQIEAKFDLGQTVYAIHRRYETISRECTVCQGKGTLALVIGGRVGCTQRFASTERCDSGRVHVAKTWPWSVYRSGTVGSIRFELYDRESGHDDKRQYMLHETGVGSGSLYDEAELFASREEATAECFARNALLPEPEPITE